MLMSTEPESDEQLKAKVVKKVTGGDLINARKLYQDDMAFKPQFKLFLQTNDIPSLSKLDVAIEQRLCIINFPNVFVSEPKGAGQKQMDMTLKNKLTGEVAYRQEFMLMLLDVYQECGLSKLAVKLAKPKQVEEATGNYISENNPIKAFLDEHCELTGVGTDKVSRRELYEQYHAVSEVKVSSKKFVEMCRYNGIQERKSNGVMCCIGIKMRAEEPANENLFA